MNRKSLFNSYFKNLSNVAGQGDAREESFYQPLADMLRELAQATGRAQVHITTLPRATEAGNPAFRLWNGRDRIRGYIASNKPT